MTPTAPAPAPAPAEDDRPPSIVLSLGAPTAPAERRRMRRANALATAILLALTVRAHLFEPVRVTAASMSPGLRAGDTVLVDKVTYRVRGPHRGEVVITSDPESGARIVKRVVGVGGDVIEIYDGQLVRNGEPVAEPYADQDRMGGYFFGPVTIPAGTVFVLGDHRIESTDSRRFGPVDTDDVEGRVLAHW